LVPDRSGDGGLDRYLFRYRLTSRERDVLKLVAGGLTNREIAQRLGNSSRTIDAHVRSIYAKIGVASRSAATRYALELGLV
jgi:DNA-binding NarL/FixJ family response regulator